MAKQQPVARKQSRSNRDQARKSAPGLDRNGHDTQVAKYEDQLASYLEGRIKPGLNRGAIPLVARSIAKEIAHQEYPERAFGAAEAGHELDDEAETDFDDG